MNTNPSIISQASLVIAMLVVATKAYASPVQKTPNVISPVGESKILVQTVSYPELLNLPTISPYLTAVEGSMENDKAKEDYKKRDGRQSVRISRRWEEEQHKQKKLKNWELHNEIERIINPFGIIELDTEFQEPLSGNLGKIYGVYCYKTVYGPGKWSFTLNQEKKLLWRWEVPSRLQKADWSAAGTSEPYEEHNIALTLFKWDSKQTDETTSSLPNPLLFRFDKNGLQWTKIVPVIETRQQLHQEEVNKSRLGSGQVFMSPSGKRSWFVANNSKEVLFFVYSAGGDLLNTVKINGTYNIGYPRRYSAFKDNAFIIEFLRRVEKKDEVETFVFDVNGKPLYRLVNAEGKPVKSLWVSSDGTRAHTEQYVEGEGMKQLHFRFDNIAKP